MGLLAGDMGRPGGVIPAGRGELKFWLRGVPAGDIGREADPGPCAGGRAYWFRCDGFGLDGFVARHVRGTTPC